MNITVIGGGAVGLLTAYFCAESGFHTEIVTRTFQQAKTINACGIIRISGGDEKTASVFARSEAEVNDIQADIVIVALKQTALPEWTSWAKAHINIETPLIMMQNGMGHIELMEKEGHLYIHPAVVTHGVMRQDDSSFVHTGHGEVKVSRSEWMNLFSRAFQKNGMFSVTNVNDIDEALKQKLLVNVKVNSVTGIYGVKNGDLVSDPQLMKHARRLFEEAADVLDLEEASWQKIHHVLEITAENQSSMLVDLENRRITEADALTGYVLELAKTRGKVLPYTASVHKQIKQLEKEGRE